MRTWSTEAVTDQLGRCVRARAVGWWDTGVGRWCSGGDPMQHTKHLPAMTDHLWSLRDEAAIQTQLDMSREAALADFSLIHFSFFFKGMKDWTWPVASNIREGIYRLGVNRIGHGRKKKNIDTDTAFSAPAERILSDLCTYINAGDDLNEDAMMCFPDFKLTFF